jgi:hypothetical protein
MNKTSLLILLAIPYLHTEQLSNTINIVSGGTVNYQQNAPIATFLIDQWDHAKNFSYISLSYMKSHPYKSVGWSLAITYGALNYYFYSMQSILSNGWSSWKSEYSLAELLQMNQSDLRKSLLNAIQQHYIQTLLFVTESDALRFFLHDIKEEQKKLYHYQLFMKWLYRIKVGKFFYFTMKSEEIQKLIERAVFLESIIKSFLEEKNTAMLLSLLPKETSSEDTPPDLYQQNVFPHQ